MDDGLRGSPSLVGRWIAKDEEPSARIQCALRPGVQIPLPARMSTMKVRTYDEIDPDDAFRLSFLAFGEAWSGAKVRRVRSTDKRYFDEFALYAEERGRVLAQVVPLRFRVRLRSGVEEVGGIAGVCTHPAAWGRGYARRLMAAAHDRFRRLNLRISTLTTSRNIRGYGLYSKLGYVDIAPFKAAVRRVSWRSPPNGYRFRFATKADVPRIHALYREHTRNMLGWTERPAELLRWNFRENRDDLSKYRILLRHGRAVAYLRTRPEDGVSMEEVVAPTLRDFRAALAFVEAPLRGQYATVNWITASADLARFRNAGYSVDGPIPDTTMAISLAKDVRTAELPGLFGGTSGRFVQYPTDDF